ncbi:hypothetical protein OAO01_05870 [Oligoflexia bacterium]|nr:hypothetical protein [Oligoflexia bacterium]
MQDQSEQREANPWKATFLKVARLAISPLQALYMAHLFLLLYVVVTLGLTYFACTELIAQMSEYFAFVQNEYTVSPKALLFTEQVSTVLIWCLTLPIVLTVCALPVHSLWVNGRFKLFEVIKATPGTIARTLNTLVLTLRPIFYISATPVVMLVAQVYFFDNFDNVVFRHIYVITCVVVCCFSFFRVLPFLLTPLVTVCTQYHPHDAMATARDILPRKNFTLATVLAISALTVYGCFSLVPLFNLSPQTSALLLAIMILITIWYASMILGVIILDTITLFQSSAPATPQVGTNGAQQNYGTQAPPGLEEMAEMFRAMQAGTVNVYIENYLTKR